MKVIDIKICNEKNYQHKEDNRRENHFTGIL